MRSVYLTLGLLLTPPLVVAQVSHRDVATSRSQLDLSFDRFSTAFQVADADELASMLTEDYVHTGPTGSVLDKEEWLSWVRERHTEIDSGEYRYDRYTDYERSIRMYGEVGVITGLVDAAGIRHGEPFEFRVRYTQVWVRDDGHWKRTAFHDSRVNN